MCCFSKLKENIRYKIDNRNNSVKEVFCNKEFEENASEIYGMINPCLELILVR